MVWRWSLIGYFPIYYPRQGVRPRQPQPEPSWVARSSGAGSGAVSASAASAQERMLEAAGRGAVGRGTPSPATTARVSVSSTVWREAERGHLPGRERMGSPTLQTLQDPILLLRRVCFRGGGFPNPSTLAQNSSRGTTLPCLGYHPPQPLSLFIFLPHRLCCTRCSLARRSRRSTRASRLSTLSRSPRGVLTRPAGCSETRHSCIFWDTICCRNAASTHSLSLALMHTVGGCAAVKRG
jgi:hypothetical protein